MDIKEQLSNATVLIEQLNKENEELKKKSIDDELELSLCKSDYDETLNHAKELIATCESVINEYRGLIYSLKKAKQEYDSSIKEIYKLKKRYKKELERLINQID